MEELCFNSSSVWKFDDLHFSGNMLPLISPNILINPDYSTSYMRPHRMQLETDSRLQQRGGWVFPSGRPLSFIRHETFQIVVTSAAYVCRGIIQGSEKILWLKAAGTTRNYCHLHTLNFVHYSI
jgi:hypothetical protein